MNHLKTPHDSEPDDTLETSMAMVASALSDPSRVSILCALMDGRAWTATELGAMLNTRPRRKPSCPCLDWSERRFHLGGDAGSALMTLFLQKEWITRTPGYREVKVTDSGRAAMYRLFELKVTPVDLLKKRS